MCSVLYAGKQLLQGERKLNIAREKCQLSKVVSSSYIDGANKEVSVVMKSLGKRGPYLKLTTDKKAVIGKYAAEYSGIVAAVRHFSNEFPELKETTVHGRKVKYLSELQVERW